MELNKYEMGVVIRADLPEEGFRAELDRVQEYLTRFGATIEKVDEWGRRKLAYPIAKQTEGMYTFIYYTAPGSTAREVESRVRLMENVLRFLTINLNEAEAAKAKATSAQPEQPTEQPTEQPVEQPAEEPVEIAAETEPAEAE